MSTGTEVVVKTDSGKNAGKTFLIVCGVLFVLGFGLWIKQVTGGSGGYSAQYAWGLYIAAFFTAVAGGAGAMILGAIVKWMNLLDDGKSRRFYSAAIAMFIMAGFFILADLGAPLNILKLVLTSNASAPMVFDFWLLLACVVLCLLAVFYKGRTKNIALAGLILAVILLGAESWLVASAAVQQLWGITMGGGTAFIQAGIMSFALLMLTGQDAKFARVGLVIAMILSLVVSLTDLLAGLGDAGRLGMQWTAVAGSGVFWAGMVLGILVPVIMLVVKNPTGISTATVPVLAMISVLLTKLGYIWSSQSVPGIEQIAAGAPHFNIEEAVIVIGFISLGILVYLGLNAGKGGAQS